MWGGGTSIGGQCGEGGEGLTEQVFIYGCAVYRRLAKTSSLSKQPHLGVSPGGVIRSAFMSEDGQERSGSHPGLAAPP